jgi:hypothetical protein
MLSLSALASWESVILASIQGASGTIEERDAQITRSGMYAEYPAIFTTYLDLAQLADDPPTALEALKRAVFLAWHAFTAPSVFSGIAELPESSVRELMDALDRAIVEGRTDHELRAMLAWYHENFGYVFDHFGPVRGLEDFVAGQTAESLTALTLQSPARFQGRGQMGAYWLRVGGTR